MKYQFVNHFSQFDSNVLLQCFLQFDYYDAFADSYYLRLDLSFISQVMLIDEILAVEVERDFIVFNLALLKVMQGVQVDLSVDELRVAKISFYQGVYDLEGDYDLEGGNDRD
ncbi:MAG: hypothetical protein EZS28_001699 [Streblomastix strix]|uniref:Uncharacterized protein n=1 Tax=Streblomastix strix TaxID=222440 RepID=A0A5J4X6H8_9EUKA|nr:MAG: hypothetical protein EZS28_001699 [Streblomastix strix]